MIFEMNWTWVSTFALAVFGIGITVGTTQDPQYSKRLFLPLIKFTGVVGMILGGLVIGIQLAYVAAKLAAIDLTARQVVLANIDALSYYVNTIFAVVDLTCIGAGIGFYCAWQKFEASRSPTKDDVGA